MRTEECQTKYRRIGGSVDRRYDSEELMGPDAPKHSLVRQRDQLNKCTRVRTYIRRRMGAYMHLCSGSRAQQAK